MSPWMTRQEAADYLCCGVDTIDRMTLNKKLRYHLMELNKRKVVRIVREDVIALCPEPKEMEQVLE